MEDDVLYKQDCSFLRNSDANLMVAKVVASLFVARLVYLQVRQHSV